MVSTSRSRELWRDLETGEAFVVEVEGDRVIAAEGPVDSEDVEGVRRIWTAPTAGRAEGFTMLATELGRRRDGFERRPLPPV